MNDYEKIRVEDDAKVFVALQELHGYAEGYGGPAEDHKGCKPNFKALSVLVSCFPDGPPDPEKDEDAYGKWFEGLLQCYDYPEETMLAEACENAEESFVQKYAHDNEKRMHFLSLLNEEQQKYVLSLLNDTL